MAVNNSLARQDQSMKLSVYLQNDAVKKQINQVVGGKEWDKVHFQYCKCGAEYTGAAGVYKPEYRKRCITRRSSESFTVPALGQFYMVPFDNKKKGCKEAQFQLGYKGYIQLAIRSVTTKKSSMCLQSKKGSLSGMILWMKKWRLI